MEKANRTKKWTLTGGGVNRCNGRARLTGQGVKVLLTDYLLQPIIVCLQRGHLTLEYNTQYTGNNNNDALS